MIISDICIHTNENIDSLRRIGMESPVLLQPINEETSISLQIKSLDINELTNYFKWDLKDPTSIDYWPEHNIDRKAWNNITHVKPIRISYLRERLEIKYYECDMEWDIREGYTVDIKGFIELGLDLSPTIIN